MQKKHAALGLLAGLTWGVVSCGPAVPPTPFGVRGPLTPAPGVSHQIDVRRIDFRPRLAVIRREGDPGPALVIAIAPGAAAADHAALAGMLAGRLRDAGFDVLLESDGFGLRLVATPRPEGIEALLRAWVKAASTPAAERDVEAANARVAVLREHPLASAALEPLARCSGDPAPVAVRAKPKTLVELEALRQSALVLERTAVALVGDSQAADAATAGLEAVDGWPRGEEAPAPNAAVAHGVFFSGALEPGQVRLHVAVQLGDAVKAVGAASRLRRGPPLSTKLDALMSPWRLEEIRAVAHPHGGCVRVTVSGGVRAGHVAELSASASAAARVVWRELLVQEAVDTDPFLVTREIIAAGDARESAARAAWWALSGTSPTSPAMSSALEVGAPGKEPLLDDGGRPLEEDTVRAGYVQALGPLVSASPGPIAGRRSKVEPGQGELWVMVASPCPLRHEGDWDAGAVALAATTVAARNATEVTVEPFVSADGVGVIAHGSVLFAEETQAALAERVANAAASAYATVPVDATDFARAKRVVLQHTADERGAPFFAFARRAIPDHPSWLAPWGTTDRALAVDLDTVADTWRAVLHGPTRIAVLGNDAEGAVGEVGRIVDHWLLPEAVDGNCPQLNRREAPRVGVHPVVGSTPQVIVGLPFGSAKDRALAELTGAHVGGADGPLARTLDVPWKVEVLGGASGGALVITAVVAGDEVDRARAAAVELLGGLASRLDAAADARARGRLSAERERALRHPRGRLGELWRGVEPAPLPTLDAWRGWLQTQATAARLVIVTAE